MGAREQALCNRTLGKDRNPAPPKSAPSACGLHHHLYVEMRRESASRPLGIRSRCVSVIDHAIHSELSRPYRSDLREQSRLLQANRKIHESGVRCVWGKVYINDKSRNNDHMHEKETKAHSNSLGDLYKTGNKPIPDSHRITFPLFAKPVPHLLVLCYGSRVSNSSHVHPPRNPRALYSKHRPGSVRFDRTFDNPTSMSQSNQCQSCHETQ